MGTHLNQKLTDDPLNGLDFSLRVIRFYYSLINTSFVSFLNTTNGHFIYVSLAILFWYLFISTEPTKTLVSLTPLFWGLFMKYAIIRNQIVWPVSSEQWDHVLMDQILHWLHQTSTTASNIRDWLLLVWVIHSSGFICCDMLLILYYTVTCMTFTDNW